MRSILGNSQLTLCPKEKKGQKKNPNLVGGEVTCLLEKSQKRRKKKVFNHMFSENEKKIKEKNV
jgi:hypothetical protein